jgi:hypothetical protein
MQENSKIGARSRPRDPRLDFFRGVAMFIIFLAHTPGNWWVQWIPARFGFSDATEIFVFCSGMASAIAFGTIFERQGWLMGTARILHRAWQVYWAHIALFFTIVAQLVVIDYLMDPTGNSYTGSYNLTVFFDNIRACIVGLLTLTYVPNYWDILPMYFVILLLVPVVIWLHWQHWAAPFIFCALLWLVAGQGYLNLPAEPWSNRPWFFNPFAWQLLFFTGFAFMRGWLPTPPIRKDWMLVAGAVLVLSFPFSTHYLLKPYAGLQEIANSLWPMNDKTTFGILRYVHFLALAYVAYSTATLMGTRLSGVLVDIARKVGQQSLAVFLASLFLAQTAGTAMNVVGHSYLSVAIINFIGFAGLFAVALIAGWFKSSPWKKTGARPAPVGSEAGPAKSRTSEEQIREDTDDYARQMTPRVSPAE